MPGRRDHYRIGLSSCCSWSYIIKGIIIVRCGGVVVDTFVVACESMWGPWVRFRDGANIFKLRKLIICGMKRSNHQGRGRVYEILTSRFFLRRRNGPASLGMHIRTAGLAPAYVSPSAAAPGSAAHSLTCADRSMVDPLAYPLSGVAQGLAFSRLSAALPGYVFAPPSTAVPWFVHAGTPA